MGRKLEMMGRKVMDVLEKVDVLEGDLGQHLQEGASREQLVFTGPADWTADQAEQYIDWRIHLVDAQVSKLRQQLDDLTTMRRRWLSVTGGRSKVFGAGNGNGSGNGNGNGNGHEIDGE